MADDSPEESPSPETAPMPRWVPALIGGILVLMAGLAVYTGLRYRHSTLANGIIRSSKTPHSNEGPPGEPAPGASLVFPGESAENVPKAQPPVAGHARTEVRGGAGGVTATLRLWARRGMMISVQPDDAVVYVNDLAIGEAKQFNSHDEVYDFPAPGSYTIKLTAPGYKEQQFVVTAAESAKQEIVQIEAKLEKQ